MAKQRKTKNLGWNRSRDDPKVYDYIENVLGIKEKRCGRGSRGGSGPYGLVHQGKNPVPIREFHLHKAYVDPNGRVVIESKDGLQGACIKCDRAYRRARLNRYSSKYSGWPAEKIYAEYKKNYGRETKRCSICHEEKKPEDFPISRGMETGLHNVCKACSKSYSESVGGRWEIYSPDGHEVIHKTEKDSCRYLDPDGSICGSKENLHKDHIWPIARGGTDNKENIQILCGKHNLSKSDSITMKSLGEIKDRMICERYRPILDQARKEGWSVRKFDLEISKAVRKFILWKSEMTDDELRKFFGKEKVRNNRKHSVDHAVRKFRQYCETAILEVDEYLAESSQ